MDDKKLIDVRQTLQYGRYMQKLGWEVKRLINTPGVSEKTLPEWRSINIFIKKLPLLPFSVIKVLRFYLPSAENRFFKNLKSIGKKHRALFIKAQPFILENVSIQERLPRQRRGESFSFLDRKNGFKPDKNPLTPTKTIWLDLNKTETLLLKDLKPKTRYNLRLSQKKGLMIKIIGGHKITDGQLSEFFKVWQKNKPFNWLFKPSFNNLKSLIKSFGDKCFFVFADSEQLKANRLIAGALILTSPNMAFYWHNCSSPEGKKLFAPTLIVWQAIKEAKKRGLEIFDFEGIYDERFHQATKNWQGFSKFKKSFGGEIITFRTSEHPVFGSLGTSGLPRRGGEKLEPLNPNRT